MAFFGVHNKKYVGATSGFSTLELLVAISIFVALTSFTLTSQTGMNNRVNVDTLAHNIGQWVRDAQISAMSVRRSSAGTFPPGYGLHFATAQNNQFIYFRDLDPDGTGPGLPNKRYDAGEAEQTIQLLQGYTISSICGAPGGANCGGVGSQTVMAYADVTFARPEPDATITGPSGTYSPVRITVSSPKGLRRAIVIYGTGQVSIQSAP